MSDGKIGNSNKPNKEKLEILVRNLLFSLSFKTSLAGCGYLCEALVEYCLRDYVHPTLSRDVYPVIMQKHNAKRSSIDRDISTAIKNCYDFGNMRKLNDLFGCKIVDDTYPPTNLEFIANVGARIKLIAEHGDADNLLSLSRPKFSLPTEYSK